MGGKEEGRVDGISQLHINLLNSGNIFPEKATHSPATSILSSLLRSDKLVTLEFKSRLGAPYIYLTYRVNKEN